MDSGLYCSVAVTVKGKFQQRADVLLSGSPEDAPILHFNGALTFLLRRPAEQQPLVRGQSPGELWFDIGTPNPAGGEALVAHDNGFPLKANPVAEVEFPSATPGPSPIKVRVVLKERC